MNRCLVISQSFSLTGNTLKLLRCLMEKRHFFLFLGGTGDWTQDLCVGLSLQPFLLFPLRQSLTKFLSCPGWSWIYNCPASASKCAEITDMCHHPWPENTHFCWTERSQWQQLSSFFRENVTIWTNKRSNKSVPVGFWEVQAQICYQQDLGLGLEPTTPHSGSSSRCPFLS